MTIERRRRRSGKARLGLVWQLPCNGVRRSEARLGINVERITWVWWQKIKKGETGVKCLAVAIEMATEGMRGGKGVSCLTIAMKWRQKIRKGKTGVKFFAVAMKWWQKIRKGETLLKCLAMAIERRKKIRNSETGVGCLTIAMKWRQKIRIGETGVRIIGHDNEMATENRERRDWG